VIVTLVVGHVQSARLHAQPDGGPDAIVAYMTGKAFVTHADRTVEALAPGTPLQVGERVCIHPGGRATIVFPDRPQQVWEGGGAGNSFTVAQPCAPRGGVIGRVWRYLCGKLRPRPQLTTPAASRGDEDKALAGLEPANSLERRTPVAFGWDATPGATYTVEVMNGGAEPLWTATDLTENRVTYPTDAPPLTVGERYYLRVTAKGPGDLRAERPLVWFELMDEERCAEVDRALHRVDVGTRGMPEPLIHLHRAAVLASYKLQAEARQELALADKGGEGRAWGQFIEKVTP
jgi:hypothetical protein